MSGGAIRRFPRTARAGPEAAPKIEREKIKKRRPNDHLFDDREGYSAPQSIVSDNVDDLSYADNGYHDGAEPDWTDQQGPDWTRREMDDRDASAWDEEPEGDWVLDRDDEPSARTLTDDVYDDDGEESGVVWDDHGFSPRAPAGNPAFDHPDEVAFGPEGGSYGRHDDVGPEMELAGRRDVRPKPPKSAPPPRAQAPRPAQRRQRCQSPPQRRQLDVDWSARAEPELREPAMGDMSFEQRPTTARPEAHAHPASPVAESGRFSRTRATLGGSAGGTEETLLQPTRRAPRQRRRKASASAAPARIDQSFAIQYGRRRGKALIATTLLTLLAVGGWFAYQSIGPSGFQPLIDRVTALIPLPSSSRTAADTSFGDQGSAETVSAERALSALEERIRQQNGGESAPAPAAPSIDPATIATDGPPIPEFKPLPGATRSLTGKVPARGADPARGIDEAELAAEGEDQAAEPSIFERLWHLLSPG